MKKLTTLEQILRVFRIPRTEDDPEIERLDKVIAKWDDQYLGHLVDAIYNEFGIDEADQRRMNAKIMNWIDQDLYEYLRLKVDQSYVNEFGDTMTRIRGYSVNIMSGFNDKDGAFQVRHFENLTQAKAWIDGLREQKTTWKLDPNERGPQW